MCAQGLRIEGQGTQKWVGKLLRELVLQFGDHLLLELLAPLDLLG